MTKKRKKGNEMKWFKPTSVSTTIAAINRRAGDLVRAVGAQGFTALSKGVVAHLPMVLALLIAGSSWQSAHGSVVFSNFGPGDSYAVQGLFVGGDQAYPNVSYDLDLASRFQLSPSASYTVDSVDIVLANIRGTNAARLHLFSEKSGRPNKLLDTIHLSDLPIEPAFTLSLTPLTTALSVQNPTLKAGEAYWLAVDVSGDTEVRWNIHALGKQGSLGYATRIDGGRWKPISVPPPNGTFRIHGTLVPEPSASLLIVIGMTIGCGRGFRG